MMEVILDRVKQKNHPVEVGGENKKSNLDSNGDNINLLQFKSRNRKNEIVSLIYLTLKAETLLKNTEGKDTVSKVRTAIEKWG